MRDFLTAAAAACALGPVLTNGCIAFLEGHYQGLFVPTNHTKHRHPVYQGADPSTGLVRPDHWIYLLPRDHLYAIYEQLNEPEVYKRYGYIVTGLICDEVATAWYNKGTSSVSTEYGVYTPMNGKIGAACVGTKGSFNNTSTTVLPEKVRTLIDCANAAIGTYPGTALAVTRGPWDRERMATCNVHFDLTGSTVQDGGENCVFRYNKLPGKAKASSDAVPAGQHTSLELCGEYARQNVLSANAVSWNENTRECLGYTDMWDVTPSDRQHGWTTATIWKPYVPTTTTTTTTTTDDTPETTDDTPETTDDTADTSTDDTAPPAALADHPEDQTAPVIGGVIGAAAGVAALAGLAFAGVKYFHSPAATDDDLESFGLQDRNTSVDHWGQQETVFENVNTD